MAKRSFVREATYFKAHASCLEQLKTAGKIVSESLELEWIQADIRKMSGNIICRGNLNLEVRKILKYKIIEDFKYVRTQKYSYNLSLPGQGCIFRYDNVHPHPNHPNSYHIHRYNPPDHEITGSPFPVENPDDWPTLFQVVVEADKYYWDEIYSK